MEEAIKFFGNRGWKQDARSIAFAVGTEIISSAKEGKPLKDCVDSVRTLSAMHLDLASGKRQLAIIQDIINFAPEHVANELRSRVKSDDLFSFRDKVN